jgi:rhodanese-related sulfurtransferase
MSIYLENMLLKKGINIIKNNMITEIQENQVILADGNILSGDMVIMATGVRPETKLVQEAGVAIGSLGGIVVNEKMQTNVPDIYACGDCIETFSVITGKPVYHPLGSTANKTGRIAGDVITGGDLSYKGNLGPGIFRVFDLVVATTGLGEEEAIKEGYDIVISHNTKPNKPAYFDGEEMVIKTIADKKTKCILGVQIIGGEGVDKRIDVFVTLITYKATVDELFHLDLAYAPPFSTTKDPVHYSGMILDNSINRGRELIRAEKVIEKANELQIIDTRSLDDYNKKGHVEGALHIPQEKLREMIPTLDPEKPTVTYCNKGTTGNATQNILINHGFKEVYNLSGGHSFYKEINRKGP